MVFNATFITISVMSWWSVLNSYIDILPVTIVDGWLLFDRNESLWCKYIYAPTSNSYIDILPVTTVDGRLLFGRNESLWCKYMYAPTSNSYIQTTITHLLLLLGGYQYNCLMLVHTYIYIIKIHSYQTTITHLLLLLGGYQYNCLMLGVALNTITHTHYCIDNWRFLDIVELILVQNVDNIFVTSPYF
jgi:hypothetical protein